MSIAIRKGESYYKLSYSTDSSSGTKDVVVPAPTVSINVDIFINNRKISYTSYEQMIYNLALRFIPFWQMGLYDASIDISSDSAYTFTLVCKDSLFHTNGAVITTSHLSIINLKLQCLFKDPVSLEKDLVSSLNYLLTSWYIHMEQEYPCVVSIVGRKYIELNLFWYRRTKQILQIKEEHENLTLVQLVENLKKNFTMLKLLLDDKAAISILDEKSTRFKGYGVVGSYPLQLIEPND
ncbi:hypothetical protein KGF56_004712 [Candida oxycetoniae]|uniref:Uncharacterized protein n=1 Tax=Candida oxycetoniae TaxID=497107 RepID=A0AAI9STQ3_9ASCO|nr:uncharacterized protein KGF56_004712 [Candida oxycetoniae]KAI3402471.2 hypothetical protein KGF56_004712 [Candida oxycetoniae]